MTPMPGRHQILLASNNKGKLLELRGLLAALSADILSAADFPGFPQVVEDGRTFCENAAKKARAAAEASGILTIADDSGLEVDALSGRPGIYSARFAGEPADDARNNAKLLELLQGIPLPERTARFVCAIAVAPPRGEIYYARGVCSGLILEEPRGSGGFGYDPLFFLPDLQKTFAELSFEEKSHWSHRGRALREAAAIIGRLLE